MGKGSDTFDRMRARAQSEESPGEKQRKLRPELRLAPDTLIEAGADTSTREALGHLAREGVGCVEVRDTELDVDAVLIPTERYIALMTRVLELEAFAVGRTGYYPPGLATSNLKQVDPDASWDAFFRSGGVQY
jgi:hypothetical protein